MVINEVYNMYYFQFFWQLTTYILVLYHIAQFFILVKYIIMLQRVKNIINKNGMPEYINKIKNTDNVHEYVRAYHKHSFILTTIELKPTNIKYNIPIVTRKGDEMKIVLRGNDRSKRPLKIDGINKIVLDLRDNIGGNMHYTFDFLKKIYGDTLLYKCLGKWYSLKNGKYVEDKLSRKLAFKGTIIVLVSHKTASSGEIIALSFMGRKNAWILGSKTAGFLTMNEFFTIDKNHMLNLTVSRFIDINGHEYVDECITPSIEI